MFRGLHNINLDAKGRLAVPSKYRDTLGDVCAGQLVVTLDVAGKCLLVYPLPEWNEIQKKLDALPSFNPVARSYQRILIGHATDLEMDANGRILIPQALRERVGMSKESVLLGQGKKFELWSKDAWEECCEESISLPENIEMPKELLELSL